MANWSACLSEKDNAGKAKFACMRGITGNLKKRMFMAVTRNLASATHRRIRAAAIVAVFEAPIDALSHATLQELEGWKWNGYRFIPGRHLPCGADRVSGTPPGNKAGHALHGQ